MSKVNKAIGILRHSLEEDKITLENEKEFLKEYQNNATRSELLIKSLDSRIKDTESSIFILEQMEGNDNS
jgi:hypothetical protein